VCRTAVGDCDVAESCTGSAVDCPTDALQPDATPCNDGLACNEGELCTSGVCGGGAATDCNDGNPCTSDTCGEPTGCESVAITGCSDDAGVTDDAGTITDDAGTITDDAGPADGGSIRDASTDGAALDGAAIDAGTPPAPADKGGCSCTTAGAKDAGRSPLGGAWLTVLGLVFVTIRARRRAKR
jgi:MYXO-CTERM domain-containing protein